MHHLSQTEQRQPPPQREPRFYRGSDDSLHKIYLLLAFVFAASLSAHALAPVAEKGTNTPATAMAAIQEDVKSGQYAQAVVALTGLVGKTPHAGTETYRLLAFSEFKLQNNDQALAACEQGLVLYPAARSLGELYVLILHQALPPQSRQARLTELSQRIPNAPIILKALGEALMESDPASTRAFSLLSTAVKLSPQDPEARFFYGEAACFNKKDDVCIRELTRAHQLAPKNEYANMQLYTMVAVAEDRRKEPVQAARAFARSLQANEKLSPPSPYAALKYVVFLAAQGREKEAMQVIAEVLKWDPAYGPAHFEQAKIIARQGSVADAASEAESALQDARSTTAELRSYHAFLAKTYFAMGRESEARIHQDWIEGHQAANPEP